MTRLAAGLMTVAVLGWTAGVGGLGGGAAAASEKDGGFSPLFARRLEVETLRMDRPPDRGVLVAAVGLMEQPMEIIASGTPYSYCLGSLCGGSTCLGSACVGSTCLGSGCSGSTCTGSACLGSTCLGSVCLGSRCLGSACSGCGAEQSPAGVRS